MFDFKKYATSYWWAPLLPILIYGYFFDFRTMTIYGDDLYRFHDFQSVTGLCQRLTDFGFDGKFRPIFSLICSLCLNLFGKNLTLYYVFNVFIQSVNSFIFILTVDLIVESIGISFYLGLLFAFSRFAFYNVSQLYNGGPLEGIAMTFFLLCLYNIIKLQKQVTSGRAFRHLLICLFWANLAVYTHERYLALFVFIALVALFLPVEKKLDIKKRLTLVVICGLSIGLNVILKTHVFHISFLLGTSNAAIVFSPLAAFGFLEDGLLSIIQINSGQEFCAGYSHNSLSFPYQLLLGFITLLWVYGLAKLLREISKKSGKQSGWLLGSLILLFFCCLAPAIVTIRLEQRWLEASFSIFLVIVSLSFCYGLRDQIRLRNILLIVFVILFLISDRHFLTMGANNFFQKEAERSATIFRQAVENHIIKIQSKHLFLYTKDRNTNYSNGLYWAVGGGYICDYYNGGNDKSLSFLDSLGIRSDSSQIRAMSSLDSLSCQVLVIQNGKAIDMTSQFFRDSLNSYRP